MATKKKMLQAAAGNATGGGGLNVEDVFSTYLWDGDGTTSRDITNNIDLSGEGGMVWIKNRDGGDPHVLFDTERGANNSLTSNTTAAEVADYQRLKIFFDDGFRIGSDVEVNASNGDSYASWTFRKTPKFFDVVTYTGNGVQGRDISHNLGVAPGMVIVKRTDSADNWAVQHRSLGGSKYLRLNSTTEALTNAYWDSTDADSAVFRVGSNGEVNANGATYVAYLFAHNDGDGEFGGEADADIIKCGSFTATGDTSIDLGFEPQWLLVKRTDSSENWKMFDSMRGFVADYEDRNLIPNSSNAESDDNFGKFESKGFQCEEGSGKTYIYIAIRRGTKVPESASEVFAMDTGDGSSNPAYFAGFPIDFAYTKDKNNSANWLVSSRLTQGRFLSFNTTNAESSNSVMAFDYSDRWYDLTRPSNYYSGMWKRAPGFFDVVAYTGNGVVDPGQQLNHNLGVAPEMIWVKSRSSAASWECWFNGFTTDGYIRLNSDGGKSSGGDYPRFPVLPTETTFNVGGGSSANGSNEDYIAYLFASLPGISKVGSYTGNGSTGQTIDCGFTSGARFVLIKETSSANDWYVYDSERGITASADPYLKLNTTDAEATVYDGISPASSGFHITQVQYTVAINRNGAEYIFYAIA